MGFIICTLFYCPVKYNNQIKYFSIPFFLNITTLEIHCCISIRNFQTKYQFAAISTPLYCASLFFHFWVRIIFLFFYILPVIAVFLHGFSFQPFLCQISPSICSLYVYMKIWPIRLFHPRLFVLDNRIELLNNFVVFLMYFLHVYFCLIL